MKKNVDEEKRERKKLKGKKWERKWMKRIQKLLI